MKTKNHENKNGNRELMFVDLSASLDHELALIASLLGACDSEAQINFSELAHTLTEYLGHRAALESVFFNRRLGTQKMDESKFRAEISRLKRIVREGSVNV